MYWTLIAFLILLTSLVIHFLQLILASLQKNSYHPPSDAIIESVLPEEIFEHVLSFSDPLTLVRCHFVSKYWNYQSSKLKIQTMILERAIAETRKLPEVKAVDISDNHWYIYPRNYRIERRLADFALAQKHKRHLLELKTDIYTKFTNPAKYLLKTVCQLNNYPTFRMPDNSAVKIQNEEAFESKIHQKSPLARSEADYEMIFPLEQCLTGHSDAFICRPKFDVEYLLGIIPIDASLYKVAFMLGIPVIIHDILNAKWLMSDLINGIFAFLYLAGVLFHTNFSMRVVNAANNRLWLILNSVTAIVLLIGVAIFFPHSAKHFAFIAVLIAAFFYSFMVFTHFMQFSQKKTKNFFRPVQFPNRNLAPLFAVNMALVLSMIEYSMVYRSILDGTLFYRLFWNTMHWALLALYCIWNNAMLRVFYADPLTLGFKLRYLIEWDSMSVKMVLCGIPVTVYLTLCAPRWGYDQ